MACHSFASRCRQSRLPALALTGTLGIFACARAVDNSLDAATQALQSTGEYQVIATDKERGLVTVRSLPSGVIKVLDLRAGGTTQRPAVSVTPPAVLAAPPPAAVEAPEAAVADPAPTVAAAPAAPYNAAAIRTLAASGARPAALAVPSSAGQSSVLVNGPGIHIERARGPNPASAVARIEPVSLRNLTLDHSVICGAGQRLRLTNVKIDTAGAGIVLQAGCQLELIDSEIRSGDTAVIVQTGSSLRIENSILRGRVTSIDAAAAAHVRSWASTFIGPTSLAAADFVDRGGNVWE